MKIEKTDYSYHVTECDLKFGDKIVLGDELLIPASVIGKIRAEINEEYRDESEHPYGQGLRRALQIIDKYKAESESEV